MKPEEQRIAIAEFYFDNLEWDGDHPSEPKDPKRAAWFWTGSGNWGKPLPDYLNDLNASIPLLDRLSYECWKIDIQRRSDDLAFGPWFVGVFKGPTFACAQAETLACAICEVFLKVYGRWTDETPH